MRNNEYRKAFRTGSARWNRLSKEVRQAQKTCEECGSVTKLEVHHKIPWYPNNLALRYERSNLQVLCQVCHAKAEVKLRKARQPHLP